MVLVSVNPATGRRLAVYRPHTAADLERIVAGADRTFRSWRTTPVKKRGSHLRALAAELRARCDALAALATDEMGKPIAQARAEVEKCAALCAYYADQGEQLLADQRPVDAPRGARISLDPLGVVLAIMPWNFPYWQVMRAAVPALLAGNTVLLKHAPTVSGCAVAIERVFARAGLPKGTLQTLLIDTRPIARLIADPRIVGVTLTGSTRAGRSVAALAGAALKPAVLELGGSDPVIVLADADLDQAAECAAQARLINSGQSCICGKRIIVDRKIRPDFEARFLVRLQSRRLGDPTDPATDIGPLARADLRAALVDQVRRSLRQGAKTLIPGGAQAGPGFFYAPTVLTGVRPGMAAFDEETFGPVAALVTARDADDAVRLANTSRFGLGASVFTRDSAAATRVADALEAGCVFVNEIVRSMPELPFGGIKDSGFGRELGAWGLQSFANVKTILGG